MASPRQVMACAAGLLLACSRPSSTGLASDANGGEAASEAVVRWPKEVSALRVGLTPYMDRASLESTFQPLVEYLGRQLGVPVALVSTSGYGELGELMRAQKVDMGVFSPLSYVEAKEADPGLQLLLKQIAEGATTFLGYIVTVEESSAETLGDLAGKSICFVDRHSASGYLYPQALLRAQGLNPDTLFKTTVFAGNHLDCLKKLLDGEVDAAAVFSGAISAGRRQGLAMGRIKVLAKTQPIPYDAWCVRSGLPEGAAVRLKQELLLLSTASAGGRQVLGHKVRLNAWTEAWDSDYDSVRKVRALVSAKASAP